MHDLAFLGGGAAASFTAFLQVLMIDLVLAGDNAVAVGLVAAGLPASDRKKVIFYGLLAAVVMRIGFALITTWMLGIVGLALAGGLLLLWVCWKMWRDLRQQADLQATSEEASTSKPAKSFGQAFLQILVADLSMSLDNVLAVAGAAREHPGVLALGLLLSIILMGVAATWIAKLLERHRWIGHLGLLIVLYVALSMIWAGHRDVVVDLGQTAAYNRLMPDPLDIR
uniref:TerC family protein n=1 Tax=uncultured Caulobacter sp. TaxID=158749 RepID=UPI0025CE0B1D|nr:TerC family protein [uncultured Caulobacter sp.]